MLIDTHAHLDYSEFQEDFDEVIARAEAAGVTRIITIGTDLKSSEVSIRMAEKHPQVYAVVGVHPTNLPEENAPDITDALRTLAQHPRVVAIGETGMDFHRLPGSSEKYRSKQIAVTNALGASSTSEIEADIENDAYVSKQASVFQQHLDIAVELGKNVVIHQRDAWVETVDILKHYTGKLQGVFHCFGGTPEQADEIIRMGHLVSFTGIVTFKNAEIVRETVKHIPEDKFMVETDCPYLAPVPYRGKRCEPAYTALVAEKIAEVRGVSKEEIARVTTHTAEMFFNMR